ncbi:hypothetical protein, partial [Frankia sp. Cj3]|uniref:hypothetical protein n=1 Tax=Frankia sp. Cj3 TaxID=2880976 RepID=UPI001EF6B3FB
DELTMEVLHTQRRNQNTDLARRLHPEGELQFLFRHRLIDPGEFRAAFRHTQSATVTGKVTDPQERIIGSQANLTDLAGRGDNLYRGQKGTVLNIVLLGE